MPKPKLNKTGSTSLPQVLKNAANDPGLAPPPRWHRIKPGSGATAAAIWTKKRLNLGQR
jgi:hypothetical protein